MPTLPITDRTSYYVSSDFRGLHLPTITGLTYVAVAPEQCTSCPHWGLDVCKSWESVNWESADPEAVTQHVVDDRNFHMTQIEDQQSWTSLLWTLHNGTLEQFDWANLFDGAQNINEIWEGWQVMGASGNALTLKRISGSSDPSRVPVTTSFADPTWDGTGPRLITTTSYNRMPGGGILTIQTTNSICSGQEWLITKFGGDSNVDIDGTFTAYCHDTDTFGEILTHYPAGDTAPITVSYRTIVAPSFRYKEPRQLFPRFVSGVLLGDNRCANSRYDYQRAEWFCNRLDASSLASFPAGGACWLTGCSAFAEPAMPASPLDRNYLQQLLWTMPHSLEQLQPGISDNNNFKNYIWGPPSVFALSSDGACVYTPAGYHPSKTWGGLGGYPQVVVDESDPDAVTITTYYGSEYLNAVDPDLNIQTSALGPASNVDRLAQYGVDTLDDVTDEYLNQRCWAMDGGGSVQPYNYSGTPSNVFGQYQRVSDLCDWWFPALGATGTTTRQDGVFTVAKYDDGLAIVTSGETYNAMLEITSGIRADRTEAEQFGGAKRNDVIGVMTDYGSDPAIEIYNGTETGAIMDSISSEMTVTWRQGNAVARDPYTRPCAWNSSNPIGRKELEIQVGDWVYFDPASHTGKIAGMKFAVKKVIPHGGSTTESYVPDQALSSGRKQCGGFLFIPFAASWETYVSVVVKRDGNVVGDKLVTLTQITGSPVLEPPRIAIPKDKFACQQYDVFAGLRGLVIYPSQLNATTDERDQKFYITLTTSAGTYASEQVINILTDPVQGFPASTPKLFTFPRTVLSVTTVTVTSRGADGVPVITTLSPYTTAPATYAGIELNRCVVTIDDGEVTVTPHVAWATSWLTVAVVMQPFTSWTSSDYYDAFVAPLGTRTRTGGGALPASHKVAACYRDLVVLEDRLSVLAGYPDAYFTDMPIEIRTDGIALPADISVWTARQGSVDYTLLTENTDYVWYPASGRVYFVVNPVATDGGCIVVRGRSADRNCWPLAGHANHVTTKIGRLF